MILIKKEFTMPSKSKSQARFFAAAAHNPDFAKKAGVSSEAAKEWNQADKKAGTLKKGSTKPEHVKEDADVPVEAGDFEVEIDLDESDMRGWMDVIQRAEIEKNIDDADDQTLISRGNLEADRLGEEEELTEMPQRFDAFAGQDPDEFVDKTVEMTGKKNLVPIAKHPNFTVAKSKNGNGYVALDNTGNQIAIVSGYVQGKIFHEESIASKSGHKGVVYQMFMDILAEGYSILSDTLHSDSAIAFWQKLITRHQVYVVYDGEVLAKATPEKFHKYWNEDETSPSADLRLLLRK